MSYGNLNTYSTYSVKKSLKQLYECKTLIRKTHVMSTYKGAADAADGDDGLTGDQEAVRLVHAAPDSRVHQRQAVLKPR